MELQEIEVTIERNGQVKVHVQGVKGMSCVDLTQDLEAILGGAIEERDLTAEAHEEPQGERIQQGEQGHKIK